MKYNYHPNFSSRNPLPLSSLEAAHMLIEGGRRASALSACVGQIFVNRVWLSVTEVVTSALVHSRNLSLESLRRHRK